MGVFRPRKGILAVALLAAWPMAGQADDMITLRNGSRVAGHIDSVSDGEVLVTATTANGGVAKLPYHLSDIARVDMAPPAAFTAAQKQPPAQVVAALAPLVQAYAGLPTYWVLDAMGQLGDAYTTLGQAAQANAVYAEINQLYPNSPYMAVATAGMAKVLLTQGKPDQALAMVQPVIDAADKTVAPSPDESRAYANAFLVYGQILEAQKKYSQALEAYLAVKTVFYQNQTLVDESAQLVQNLRAHQPGVSVD